MVLRRVVLGCLFSTLSFCATAHADIAVQRIPIENAPPILMLKGKFTQSDDPQAFAREVAASGAKVVTFESGGGNVLSAIAYGRVIRTFGLTTFQLRAAECASACTLAFVGGVIRQAEPGSIGVHQSSFSSDTNLDSHAAVTAVQSMTAEIMSYLIEMDVDPKLLQLSLSVPSDDMRYLTASEMRSYRVTSGDISDLPKQIETSKASPETVPATGDAPVAKTPEVVPTAATSEQKALAFLTAYHDAWSMENSSALQFMDRAYGDVVEFYGKATPKTGVIDEKRKFATRWPTRAYIVKPGSERVLCSSTCRVDGVVDWYAKRDVGNRVSSGSAEFSLVWNPSDEKIVSETGKVIETDKGASRPVRLLSRWHQENLHCRGSSGNTPETMAVCDRREAVGAKLESVGWCYGREGEYGYQMEWHVCDGISSKSNVAVAATAQVVSVQQPKPADYPSRARMKGETVLPDFKKRDREFNSFRTRIREGMKQGPNFAGHYSVIQFGCGTGCSGVVVADNRTGRPSRFPRGGEDNMYLDLQFQVDSRLLATQWLDYDTNRCFIEFFDYDRQSWNVMSKVDVGGSEACYRSIGENLR